MADSFAADRLCLYFSPRIVRLLTDWHLWANNQPQDELASVGG